MGSRFVRRVLTTRTVRRTLLAGGLALMLGGCAVGPDNPDPREVPAIAGGEASAGSILLNDVYVRGPVVRGGSAGVALTISNDGEQTDRLVRATSPAANAVSIEPTGRLSIPPFGSVDLQDGRIVTLRDMHRTASDGDTVPITFVFAHAGPVTVDTAVEATPGIS
jgi:copper(I)-binding protein